jgi:arylsulfatase A-like enzyme
LYVLTREGLFNLYAYKHRNSLEQLAAMYRIVPLLIAGLSLVGGVDLLRNSIAEVGADDAASWTNMTRTLERQKGSATYPQMSRIPNVLIIMTDQHRFDALGFVQKEMKDYRDKLQIKTPNIDALVKRGVYFRKAYCHSPSCAPSRSSIRTGCTVERTGVQANGLNSKSVYKRMRMFEKKVDEMETYDRVLVEKMGFVAEHYGKWHLPPPMYKGKKGKGVVINHDDYDFMTGTPMLTKKETRKIYNKRIKQVLQLARRSIQVQVRSKKYKHGQQKDPYSGFPYDPIRLDRRHGKRKKSPLKGNKSGVAGIGTTPGVATPTAVIGEMSVRAIGRLAKESQPFCLTVSFNSPHPPMVARSTYANYYFSNRSKLYVSDTVGDRLRRSAYRKDVSIDEGYGDKDKVQQWTAVYYALIEEVDKWVGKILSKLEDVGVADNNLVVFTSDHGEMLGAHSMSGKGNFFEEAMRIPLIMTFPGVIRPRTIVDQPVGQIDLFATILDYMGAAKHDNSDGESLQRYIKRRDANDMYDTRVVVGEYDNRAPKSKKKLDGDLGGNPNFMVVKGKHKLMIPKNRRSSKVSSCRYNATELLRNVASHLMSRLRVDPSILT